MLLLVALNLAVWARHAPKATGPVAIAALAVVGWWTGAPCLYPSGNSFAQLVAAKVDRPSLDRPLRARASHRT